MDYNCHLHRSSMTTNHISSTCLSSTRMLYTRGEGGGWRQRRAGLTEALWVVYGSMGTSAILRPVTMKCGLSIDQVMNIFHILYFILILKYCDPSQFLCHMNFLCVDVCVCLCVRLDNLLSGSSQESPSLTSCHQLRVRQVLT